MSKESLRGRFIGNVGKRIAGCNGNIGQMRVNQQKINTFLY
jgi:hypothetical protein